VVIDAGTAITVDFVDGAGVFHGGAIAPGAQMMLDALAQRTAALPALTASDPASDGPYAKTTPDAMQTGVVAAARGLVRVMLDRYAEAYGAYPVVIATGGDAERLFASDELVESVVPHLVLRGIAASVRRALAPEDDEAPRGARFRDDAGE
jgi:type III pantothenate kinase